MSNPYESNPYDNSGGLSMTLKSNTRESFGKTLKGNANIFGIDTSKSGENRYSEYDDLEDDERDDDLRDTEESKQNCSTEDRSSNEQSGDDKSDKQSQAVTSNESN